MARRKPRIPPELLDQLLEDADPRTVFESDGLVDELKRALAERMLEAEMEGLQFLPNLVTVFGIGVVLLLVHLLRTVLKSVIERQPFTVTNTRRLRTIGLILLSIGFLAPAVEYFLARTVLARIAVEGIALSPPFDIREDTVVAGLFVIVLATIFGYGAKLEADKALTI
jgi:hypothetical protein